MIIASFTQTYGSDRILELKLLKHDIIGNYFRNKCDYICFSFHNCPTEFIERGVAILEDLYPRDKLIIFQYDNMTYLKSIQATLARFKDLNVSYVLQIQDDHHGLNTKSNLEALEDTKDIFEFVKTNKAELLHIFSSEGDPAHNKLTPQTTITVGNTQFYKFKSSDFKYAKIWSWNDGTYFGQIDFLQSLFTIKNLPEDIWGIESTLAHIFNTNTNLYRWGINKCIFKASNIHGSNINKHMTVEYNLSRFFGDLDTWPEIYQEIKDYI